MQDYDKTKKGIFLGFKEVFLLELYNYFVKRYTLSILGARFDVFAFSSKQDTQNSK
jgi:hypothetical protein